MANNFLKKSDRQIIDIQSINRNLTEKALRMRCLGYYANVKASLLTQTIYEVDNSKKYLEDALNKIFLQRELIGKQNKELVESNRELNDIKFELEEDIREWSASLQETNKELKREVAERTEREKVLRQYEYIVSSSSDMLALLDKDFVYIAANPAYITAFNKTIEEIIGSRPADIFGKEFFEAVIKPNALRCLAGEHVQYKEWFKFLADDKRHMEINYYPYRGADNQVEGFIVNGRDITEKTATEDELAEYRWHLEHLVAERTEDLKMLNKELEAFSYSVSHDLRAPLRVINGFSQALIDDSFDKLNDTDKSHLERIKNATLHMSALIDDLLTLSRVTCKVMSKETVDLSDISKMIISELKESSPKRNVEFTLPDSVIVEDTDSGLLRIVMENLLANAWKFTKNRKEAKIEFGIEYKDGKKNYFVRDNGVGFDMKYSDKLFGAFQRLHSVKDFEGTGVGLVSVKRIIRRHGGRVWAKGEVDKGATFYFTL